MSDTDTPRVHPDPDRENVEDTERLDVVIHANYELFVAGILILQLVNSVLLFLPLREEQRAIVQGFWFVLSLYLFLDALNRWRRAPNKRLHLITYHGWMTYVGSLPIPFVTGVRLLGAGLIVRKLRAGEFRQFGQVVVSRHAQSTLLLVVFAAILFFEFGSLLILVAEAGAPAPNITTSQDAMWWSLVTISTVGYGDTFPTTNWGRAIGVLLIVAGVGLFTSITSFLSRWFMRPRETKREPLHESVRSPGPQEQIERIRTLLEEMQTAHKDSVTELEDRLAQLEQSVTDKNGNSRD